MKHAGYAILVLLIVSSWYPACFSLNARYFSRQYANRLNNACFNSHFQVSVDAINLLNQTGVSGTLDVADTITDSRILQGYLTSGTYIRPFTSILSFRWQI